MKLLYIINGFDIQISGGLRRILEMIKRLSEKNHISLLTAAGEKTVLDRAGIIDVSYYLVKHSFLKRHPKFINNIFFLFYSWLVATFFAFFKIKELPLVDIIYTSSDFFCDVLPAFWYKRKEQKVKWVAMIHHRISFRKKGIRDIFVSFFSILIQNFSFYFIKNYADVVFVYDSPMGNKIADYFISKGFNKKKIFRVKNGVDYNFVKNVPDYPKEYDGCFVGWFRPNKGIYDIVPIWQKVVEQKHDAKLILVGDGFKSDIENLKQEILKNGLDKNVILAGPASSEKVYEFYKKSRFSFFPSHEEGWGIAICEAMACGLPVVAYDLEVYQTIFPKGIIKIPYLNYSLFAESILRLLRDASFYSKYQNEAIEIGKIYDWEKIADEELAIFDHILTYDSIQ